MTPHGPAHAAAPRDRPPCDLGQLLRRSTAGDPHARETIVVRFLPLARRLARLYRGRGEPLEDLYQAAAVGLIMAVDRYSSDHGETFVAYARPMILGAIRHHFRDGTWPVHVPRSMKDRAARVVRAENELTAASGSLARPEAVAAHLGVGVAEVGEARQALAAYRPASLDTPCVPSDGDRMDRRETIGADDSEYERVELSIGVEGALRRLQARDRKILLLRLAFELTQDEIAGRTGISQMHVSRILRNARAVLTASCGLARSGSTSQAPLRRSTSVAVMGTAGLEPATSRV
jgi:RNA polymerase sigma-B factor